MLVVLRRFLDDAPHQAPTLIGCYLLKNILTSTTLSLRYAAKRFVRQQQRNEIMKQLPAHVNNLVEVC